MSVQSDRESFDKRVADLVAHRTPDELARDLLNLQDAQKQNEEQPPPPQDEPVQPEQPLDNTARTKGLDSALADDGDDEATKTSSKHRRR